MSSFVRFYDRPGSRTVMPQLDHVCDTNFTLCNKNQTGDGFHYIFTYLSIVQMNNIY